jgi:hypothetical protein
VARSMTERLKRTLASDPRFQAQQHEALVGLCELLAEQIDDAGATASNRLTAAYLSALKDLGRILTDSRGGRSHDDSDEADSLEDIEASVVKLRSA